MAIAIVIPARYASTRFPGKPLAELNGKPMLQHVYEKALAAVGDDPDVRISVATDDERIESFCKDNAIPCVMTSKDCRTGSDRVIEAADKLGLKAEDVVINLQGDVPLLPLEALKAVLNEFWNNPITSVATPVKRLRWDELDRLRESKKTTPFSGTTVVLAQQGRALWFSKAIIPAMRTEAELRNQSPLSPVFQHIGLYGYRVSTLERFAAMEQSACEKLEGLEQLRFLENGMPVQCVKLHPDTDIYPGIDSPEDMARAEQILKDGK